MYVKQYIWISSGKPRILTTFVAPVRGSYKGHAYGNAFVDDSVVGRR